MRESGPRARRPSSSPVSAKSPTPGPMATRPCAVEPLAQGQADRDRQPQRPPAAGGRRPSQVADGQRPIEQHRPRLPHRIAGGLPPHARCGRPYCPGTTHEPAPGERRPSTSTAPFDHDHETTRPSRAQPGRPPSPDERRAETPEDQREASTSAQERIAGRRLGTSGRTRRRVITLGEERSARRRCVHASRIFVWAGGIRWTNRLPRQNRSDTQATLQSGVHAGRPLLARAPPSRPTAGRSARSRGSGSRCRSASAGRSSAPCPAPAPTTGPASPASGRSRTAR